MDINYTGIKHSYLLSVLQKKIVILASVKIEMLLVREYISDYPLVIDYICS